MNILAIGPHPDDIEIGCGGTLIKYAQAGHTVNLMILTDGSYGAEPHIRRAEQEQAANFMGAKGLYWAGFRDTELSCSRELINKIDDVITQTRPDMVFLISGQTCIRIIVLLRRHRFRQAGILKKCCFMKFQARSILSRIFL